MITVEIFNIPQQFSTENGILEIFNTYKIESMELKENKAGVAFLTLGIKEAIAIFQNKGTRVYIYIILLLISLCTKII